MIELVLNVCNSWLDKPNRVISCSNANYFVFYKKKISIKLFIFCFYSNKKNSFVIELNGYLSGGGEGESHTFWYICILNTHTRCLNYKQKKRDYETFKKGASIWITELNLACDLYPLIINIFFTTLFNNECIPYYIKNVLKII